MRVWNGQRKRYSSTEDDIKITVVTVTSYAGGWPGWNSAHRRVVVLGKEKRKGVLRLQEAAMEAGGEQTT